VLVQFEGTFARGRLGQTHSRCCAFRYGWETALQNPSRDGEGSATDTSPPKLEAFPGKAYYSSHDTTTAQELKGDHSVVVRVSAGNVKLYRWPAIRFTGRTASGCLVPRICFLSRDRYANWSGVLQTGSRKLRRFQLSSISRPHGLWVSWPQSAGSCRRRTAPTGKQAAPTKFVTRNLCTSWARPTDAGLTCPARRCNTKP